MPKCCAYRQHILMTIKFACAIWNKMFDHVISLQGKPLDFTALDPACVTVPPILLVLSVPL